jgi:hypothetical protein
MLDWIDDCYEDEYIDYEAREEALAERGDIEYQDRVYEKMMRGNL